MDPSRIHQIVLESMREAVYIRDLDMNILYINAASEQLTGVSLEEAKTKKCYEVFGDEQARCRQVCPVERAIAEGVHVLHQQHSLKSPSGEIHEMQLSISPVHEAEGVAGAVVVMEAITRLKKVEKTRAKTIVALETEMERRKRVEEALRESHIWMRNIFDSLEEEVLIVSHDRVLKDINPGAERMFGYSKEEVAGHSTEAFHVDDDHYIEFGRKIWEAFDRGEPAHFEFEAKRKNGEIFPTEHSVALLKDENGKPIGIVSIVRDITERNNAQQEALRESEERLQLALKGADLGLWDWDLRTGKATRDERTAALYGYPSHEMEPSFEMWASVIHPADKPEVLDKFSKHLEGSAPFYEAEYRLISKPGETKWVLARGKVSERDRDGKPLRVVGTLLDVTDRKQAEEALKKAHDELEQKVWERTAELKTINEQLFREIAQREAAEEELRQSEERYRELVENSNDIAYLLDNKGFFTFVNSVACRVSGYSEEELVGLHYTDLILPDYRKEAERFYGRQFVKKIPNTYYEFPFSTKNGEVIWVGQNVQPIMRDDEIVGFQAITRDITKRKLAEEKLVWSETLLRQMATSAPLAYLVVDNRTDQILYFNHRFCEIWGIEHLEERMRRGELKNNDIIPDCIPLVKNLEAFAASCKPLQSEANRSVVEDEIEFVGNRTIRRFSTQLRDELDRYYGRFYIFEDISERRQAEKALRESEEKIRTLINSVPDIICFKDGEGRWLEANESDLKLFELENVHYKGKKDSELAEFSRFYRDAFLTCEETDEKAWAAGKTCRGDEVIPIPDGSSKIFDVIKVPLFGPGGIRKGLVVVGRDITERRATEALLKESEKKYHDLFEQSRDGIALVHFDGTFIDINSSFAELLGYSKEEVLTMNAKQIWANAADRAAWQEEMDRKGFVQDYEWQARKKDGTVIDCVLSSVQQRAEDGSIRYQTFWRDVSDLKKAQEHLRQSDRYRAVADLAGGIAHNFNNLLQIVMGNMELAIMDLDLGNYADVKDQLGRVLESAKFGAETVRRLQSFAGIRDHTQLSEKGVFDFSGIVRQALDISKTWWKSLPEKDGIDISMDTELQEGCLVQCEKNQLFEVVVNLVKNAAEALPEGGAIYVKTAIEGNEVVLKVRDTGTGISQHNLKRIFNPFFTTKASAGSGLGLASSRKVIEDCGGKILVESTEGKGTTFTIRLPLAEKRAKPAVALDRQAPASGKTVLVIDDMQAVLDLLKSGLTRWGHVVVIALSGLEGLEIFKENPIDIVICDLGMPGINGWEVGKRIRSICEERGIPKIPFVLLTGWGGQKTETEKIAESGVDAVVEKPINMGNMRKMIREMCEEKPPQVSQ